ncbi:MAG: class I SAM-dependent methyltransferase [Cryobacterium sp.]|nr:class I SAM-dependent methyltransferase [Cryobacterium sp.]
MTTPEARYRTKELPGVPGWMDPEDAALFSGVCAAQTRSGLRGDLLEIGVYLGKSAILLGYSLQPNERLLVCDVFEAPTGDAANLQENQSYYAGLARSSFESNYLRYHPALPEIFEGPSTDLGSIVSTPRFRFVHIDGSHLYDVVRADLALSREVSIPGAIVVLDDIAAAHTPGVTAAAWEAVANDGLAPLVMTQNKMYASWIPAAALSRDLLQEAIHSAGLPMTEHKYKHSSILRVGTLDMRSPTHKFASRLKRGVVAVAGSRRR